jgi:predicted RNA-binding Zn-ribbon protein involved in translation (DUF1610 family)
MGALKDWNEALVSHFLNRPGNKILFNVTQEVIANIHNSEGFNKSHDDSIEDFLMALSNEKTGYGKEIDNIFDCKTTEKRSNGWPVKPENIFWNAYELRDMFQSGNRESVSPEKQYFKFPNFVPPWTSHLALTILATSMNVGSQFGMARYPMIADLFKLKMNIRDEDAKNLNQRIQDEYTKKFFGGLIRYRSYRAYPRPPRIVVYYYDNNKIQNSPWGVLYKWAKEQTEYPGRFYGIGGTITDPVTVHSRFRKDDRNAMLSALNSLSSGILPSNQALDQVIIQNKTAFRQSNSTNISDGKLIALREYALELWENNQHEIRSYSPNRDDPSNSISVQKISNISEYQIMPYIYIDATKDRTNRVQGFLPRLHHTSGPPPKEGQVINIGEHKFQFFNTEYATSAIPLTVNGNHELIRSEKVIEIREDGELSKIYSFKISMNVYTETGSDIVLTQDSHGMYEWLRDDEVSQGYRIIKNMGHGYNDNLMSDICGFKIGLDYNFQRMRKDRVKEIGRTKLKLDGGSKISGGTDRRYHFDSPPHFVLTRGHASDVKFNKINPKEGEEGNNFLKEEPIQVQEKGKTVWKLSLRDDIFSDDSDSSVVKIFYELEKMGSDRVLNEETFTVVKGVDHWQLHPTAILDSNNENIEAEFDESIFTNLDSCMPISEAEKSAKEAEAKAKVEAEEAARKKAEEEHKVAEKQAKQAEEASRIKAREEDKLAEEQAKQAEEAARIKAREEDKLAEELTRLAGEAARRKAEEEPPIAASEEKPKEIVVSNIKPITTQRQVYNDSRCSSCGIPLVERKSTIFPCPGCDLPIGRCPRCRSNGAKYHCLGCDYIGP